MLVGKTQIKVRLEGIDTPERAQPFGRKAGQALAKKVFGKVIQVDDLGKDRYGRTLGIVRLGKRNINLELVQEGWAWWYRKYAPKNKELAKAEAAARKAKRGLWADPNRSRRGSGGRSSVRRRSRPGRTWTPATGSTRPPAPAQQQLPQLPQYQVWPAVRTG